MSQVDPKNLDAAKAAPASVLPAQSAFSIDRKTLQGGLAGVAAVVVMGVSAHFGYNVQGIADAFVPPPGSVPMAPLLAVLIGTAWSQYVPMPVKDVVKRINAGVVAIAAQSASSPLQAEVGHGVVVVPVSPAEQPNNASPSALPAGVAMTLDAANAVAAVQKS